MRARNVIPLDYDGDGALDLLIIEDLTGDLGSKLFRNEGGLRFRDRTDEAGLPTDLGGLGAAVGDVNNDGWPDIFVAHEDKLFVNDGRGRYEHAAGLDEVFQWPGANRSEDWRAGAAFGDVNRDGRLDLVVGHHYGSADKAPQSVRLYLNRGENGAAAFEDVTSQAGLDPIPVKAPHVEIQDIDNDGWPDIVVSVHAMQEGAATPLVFRNRGGGDVPAFETPPFSVPADRESNLGYWPAAPTLDFDRDGRLDLFGVEWVPSRDSLLYRNVSRAGNFLQVAVRPAAGTNAIGIGARIEVYEPGRLGEPAALLGRSEIATGYGYSSGQEAVAHCGLADREQVDVRIVLPHGGSVIERAGVAANQRLLISGAAP
jgi:enediyne biosynthesis protein E4